MSNKFWKRIISFLLIFTINFVQLATPTLILAQEFTDSETLATASATDIPLPSAEPITTPAPSAIPEPSENPSPSPIATIDPLPTATPSATPISIPTPAPVKISDPVATPSATPVASDSGKIGTQKHAQSNASLKTGKELNKSKEVIVKFKKDRINLDNFVGKAKAHFFDKSHNIETIDEVKDLNIKLVTSGKEPEELIEELKQDPNVAIAEPNYQRELDSVPSDSDFQKLWGMHNSGQNVNEVVGTEDADIDAPEAWDLENSSQQDIVVAVIDTGVYYDHPDLKNNMWNGANCKDDNGNSILGGCPNHGWDYYSEDNDPYDENSHGTHVSGTIAGVADNYGIVGVSKYNNIKVMALKVSDPGGYGFYDFDIIKSINFAKHNGAKVINASFGGGEYSQSIKDAIDAFPGLFITSAGNSTLDNDLYPKYPAGYTSPNIVSVAATGQSDQLASFSNYGKTTVDVGAPGVNIYSTISENTSFQIVYFENFDTVTAPSLPNNYSKTGDWGTVLDTQTYGGGAPFDVNDLTGDVTFSPYSNNANNILVSNTKYDFSNSNNAYFYFDTKCDSEYDRSGWYDYMLLEGSTNGVNYSEIYRWDEAVLDDFFEDTDPSGFAAASLVVRIPDNLLSSQFNYRIRWITDDSLAGGGKGCFIDNLMIEKLETTKGGYAYYQGTSMASPHAAGTAASIFSFNPQLTSTQVKNIVMETGDPVSALSGKTVTGKRINLYKALVQAGQTPQPTPTPTPSATPTPTPSATPSPTPSPTPTPSPSPTPIPNNPPVASNVEVTTTEDSPIIFNMSVTDADNDTLYYEIVKQPAHGLLKLNVDTGASIPNGGGITNPTILYDPDPNFNGTDEFTYKGYDGNAYSNIATATINVNNINDAPITNGESVSTNEDTSLDITLQASDIDNSNLTFTIVNNPSHGTLGTLNNNKVTYTPAANYSGSDQFSFKANDGNLDSNTSTINITVNNVDDAPIANTDFKSTDEDVALTFAATDLVSNDTDEENSELFVTSVSDSSNGTVVLNDGMITFIPRLNYSGDGSFKYTISDGTNSSIGVVNITINSVNDAPVAENLNVETSEDTQKVITLNASDVEGSSVTYTKLSDPLHGTLNQINNNKITYTPNDNFKGVDSFTYKAQDGALDSNVATVIITVTSVNDVPVTSNVAVTLEEDTQALVILDGTDIDLDSLTYSIINNPTKGSLSSISGNRVTYTPKSNFNGLDSFTYKATDVNNASSNISTVSIIVNGTNDAPSVTSVNISPTDPKTNDILTADVIGSDPEDDSLTLNYEWKKNGVNINEAFDKTLDLSKTDHGSVGDKISVTVSVSDAEFTSDNLESSTVTILNSAPTVINSSTAVDEDQFLTISKSSLVNNGVDADGDILAFGGISQITNGEINVTESDIVFTPNSNFNGEAQLIYTIVDSRNGAGTGVIKISVNPINDAPSADDAAALTDEDTSVDIPLKGTDIDGDNISFVVVSDPEHGTLGEIKDGKIIYTPALNYNGTDVFTYKANDGTIDSDVATISINVNPINDAPIASDLEYSTAEDTQVLITLGGTDVENSPLLISEVSTPKHGSLVYDSGYNFIYTPKLDYNGEDSFTYRVNDGTLNSSPATLTILVTPVNDVPEANDIAVNTNEDALVNITLNGVDVDQDSLTYKIASLPEHGTLSDINEKEVIYTPLLNYNGPDTFTYLVDDGAIDSNVATVNITVVPVNDAPKIIGINVTPTNPKANSILSAESSADDIEGDEITFRYQWKKDGQDIKEETQTSLDLSKPGNGGKGDKISVTVTALDGQDFSSMTSEEVTIGNTAPVAVSDTLLTPQNTVLIFEASALSSNDIDLDIKDKMEITSVAALTHGTAALNEGKITFTPEEGYTGDANLIYTLSDGSEVVIGSVIITIIKPLNQGQVIIAPVVNVNSDSPQVMIGNTNVSSVINVPLNVDNATLDTGSVLITVGDTKEAAIPNNISVNTESSLGTLITTLPAGIKVSGPINWNGNITLPTIIASSSVTPPAAAGTVTQTTGVIEIGAGDTPLTLSKAVRLVVPGKAGQLAGFTRGATFTAIGTECSDDSQTAGDLLADGADCKIDKGSDLVIWTKHFTKFVTYTETSIPSNTGSTGGTSSNSGSGSSNANANAPVCTDSKPGSAPLLTWAIAGENSVTLSWSKAQNPVTYYLVAYGTESGKYQFGNPNVGDGNTTSYTVKNLSGGVTYYFKVRAGNNCMPGEYSNEIRATPAGEKVSGNAEGFEADTLGKETILEASGSSTEGFKGGNKAQSKWLSIAGILLGLIVLGIGTIKLRGSNVISKKTKTKSKTHIT